MLLPDRAGLRALGPAAALFLLAGGTAGLAQLLPTAQELMPPPPRVPLLPSIAAAPIPRPRLSQPLR